RRHESDRQGQHRRAEQGCRCHQPDLERAEADLDQVGRQDDGGKAVTEAARGARGVEIDDIRSPPDLQALIDGRHVPAPCGSTADVTNRAQLLARAVLSSATRSPRASLSASSLAQKCMKIKRGCSVNM